MDSQLTCPLCEQQYIEQNPPRLLIACGHTFCQCCIKKIITQRKGSFKLICPQDGQMTTLKDNNVNNFPKNIALLKILQSKRNNIQFKDQFFDMSKIVKNQQQQQDQDTRDIVASIISPNQTKSQDAIKLQNNQKDSIASPEKNKQKAIQQEQNSNQKSKSKSNEKSKQNSNQKKQQRQICLLHQKPLEVVCVIDLKKICANCAIFGQHKGHDFKSIEEIQKQRQAYYHAILNIMEKKQTISQRISSQQTCSSIMQILTKKKQSMKRSITQRYQKLLSTIQSKQKQSMKNLEQITLKTESKLKNLMKIDGNILEKYDKWQEKSYKQIKILEGQDFQQKLHLLFVGAPNQTDVLQEGDGIIDLMYKQQQNLINQVQLALENVGVDFNMQIFNHIDNFVQLYDQSKKKKNKTRGTKTQTQLPQPQTQTINSPTSARLTLNQNKRNQQIFQPKIVQQKKVIQNPKIQTQNEILSNTVNHHHEESLLQMLEDVEVKKLQIIQQKKQEIFIAPLIKETPQKTIQFPDLVLNVSQKKLPIVVEPPPKKVEQLSKIRSPQLTERSNQKESSFILQRPNKKKLQKIKIPQKFQKMLQGLANDQVQTVDFTNAELGDATIIQICQFLLGSKAKTVKLISNKLNDDAIQKILPYMGGVITLNLSQNFLTDRVLDILFNGKEHLHAIKSIILCQNKIIERKHKAKIDKLRGLDLTLSV